MIGIILVNYNGWKDTVDCIKSLKNIKNNIRIIVVDNHSTDNSVRELKKHNKHNDFELILSDVNNGFSAGNNLGIQYCIKNKYEYIVLLNNDTTVHEDFLDNLLLPLDDSNVAVTTPKILYYYEEGKIWYGGGSISKHTCRSEHYQYNKEDNTEIENKEVTFASGCCMCFKTDLVKKIGMLDEDFFLYEEDAEYCLRILKNGYKIEYVPSSIIYHKVSSSTGKASALTQYYSIRNKYLLIHKQIVGINKLFSFCYCTLQLLFRCLKGEMEFKYFIKGLNGYIHGEKGKRNGVI